MSDLAARAALERMNLREVAVAPVHTTLASDLQSMALADPDVERKKFMERRRDELCEAYGFAEVEQRKPFAFSQGIAIIPVHGSLINRFSGSYGYVTGYNFLKSQLAAALADEDVLGIVGDFNSYGGEAAGCFETSDAIFEARGKKPMLAVIDSNAYSAAYALASAFDKIALTPSGGVGSIGVVAMHADMSKMLEKFGVKVTFIHFGEHKVDGNPYEPLPDSVKKSLQDGVNKSGEKFVALVARNRSMDAAKVKATEAQTYRADDALALGLIDTIASPSQAVQVFFDELTGSVQTTEKEDDMSAAANQPGAQDTAANEKATREAADKAALDARTAERTRVSGIQGCDEAKGREALASHIAFKTDMSVEDAKAMLAASPKAEAAAPVVASKPDAFKDAMDKSLHPQVGADGDNGNDAAAPGGGDKVAAILRDFKASGGAITEAATK